MCQCACMRNCKAKKITFSVFIGINIGGTMILFIIGVCRWGIKLTMPEGKFSAVFE